MLLPIERWKGGGGNEDRKKRLLPLKANTFMLVRQGEESHDRVGGKQTKARLGLTRISFIPIVVAYSGVSSLGGVDSTEKVGKKATVQQNPSGKLVGW